MNLFLALKYEKTMKTTLKQKRCLKSHRNRFKWHSKGSVIDVILYAVIMFTLGIFIIFGYKLMSTINTEIQNNQDLSSTSKTISSDLNSKYVNLFDGIFITVFVFLALVIIVGAYFVYIHPVFYVPSLFIIVFIVLIAAVLTNVFNEITTSEDLATERASFTLMTFVMDDLMPYVLVLAFAVVIVSYAKWRGEEGA